METKNREKLLLIVAAAGLLLLIGDYLIVSPLSRSWVARRQRIADLRLRVDQGSLMLNREQTIRERWDTMQTNTLPNNVSLAENSLLKSFDRWSQDSGVNIVSIKPQWRQNDDYMTLECRADAVGSIQTLSRFLYDVEKDPRALKVEVVEIAARDDEGEQLSLGLQVSGLILGAAPPQP